jgi:hypothetical protein
LVLGGKEALSLFFYLFFGFVALFLLLFLWSMRTARRGGKPSTEASVLDEYGRGHVSHLPQIRQALGVADSKYLAQKAPGALARRVRRERQRVALVFLSAVREDFQGLLRLAKIIAVLSPEVAAVQEFERLRLTIRFAWRYELLRMQLRAGLAPLPRLDALSDFVSSMSVRMETAIKELGERAALAEELASSFNGGGRDVT